MGALISKTRKHKSNPQMVRERASLKAPGQRSPQVAIHHQNQSQSGFLSGSSGSLDYLTMYQPITFRIDYTQVSRSRSIAQDSSKSENFAR